MAETVYGGELNIHVGGFITLNEIKDADEIYEALLNILLDFDERRECYPVVLKLDEKITIQDNGSFFKDEDCLILGHYFVYNDAAYEISSQTTSAESRGFFDWEIMENPMQNDDYGDFELQSTGGADVEQTFALWTLNGETHSASRDLEFIGMEMDEDTEKELRELSQEIYEMVSDI